MPLLQQHTTVSWGDFNRILNILNINSSIIILEIGIDQQCYLKYQTNKKTDILTLAIPD